MTLVCPAEEQTQARSRDEHDTGWQYRFKRRQCQDCGLLAQCMKTLPAHHGRQVIKNDYEAEYRAAQDFAQTPTYALVRKQHPKIERKLAEIVRYHQGRRTRFRGDWQVAIQYLLTTLVVNLKRIAKLVRSSAQGSLCLSSVQA